MNNGQQAGDAGVRFHISGGARSLRGGCDRSSGRARVGGGTAHRLPTPPAFLQLDDGGEERTVRTAAGHHQRVGQRRRTSERASGDPASQVVAR